MARIETGPIRFGDDWPGVPAVSALTMNGREAEWAHARP